MQHVGSLFPNHELNSTRPLQWKGRFLTTGPQGRFQHCKSVFTFIIYFDSHNILKRYNYPHNMMRNSSLWGAHLPWMSAEPSSSHNWQSHQEPSFCLISCLWTLSLNHIPELRWASQFLSLENLSKRHESLDFERDSLYRQGPTFTWKMPVARGSGLSQALILPPLQSFSTLLNFFHCFKKS